MVMLACGHIVVKWLLILVSLGSIRHNGSTGTSRPQRAKGKLSLKVFLKEKVHTWLVFSMMFSEVNCLTADSNYIYHEGICFPVTLGVKNIGIYLFPWICCHNFCQWIKTFFVCCFIPKWIRRFRWRTYWSRVIMEIVNRLNPKIKI